MIKAVSILMIFCILIVGCTPDEPLVNDPDSADPPEIAGGISDLGDVENDLAFDDLDALDDELDDVGLDE